MDAVPVTLGQEFRGYAAQISRGVERLQAALPRVAELPLGGTAVGTGVNTPAGFAAAVVADLAASTGLPVTEARDHFEAQGARDGLVELSGQLRTVAVSLAKICNDLRWMGSGPRTGLGELRLPDLQPGSSIMPGKVNPVVPEATLMVCAHVIGHDATVGFAGASGNLELNVMMPVMGKAVLESCRWLAAALRSASAFFLAAAASLARCAAAAAASLAAAADGRGSAAAGCAGVAAGMAAVAVAARAGAGLSMVRATPPASEAVTTRAVVPDTSGRRRARLSTVEGVIEAPGRPCCRVRGEHGHGHLGSGPTRRPLGRHSTGAHAAPVTTDSEPGGRPE
jgi:hypothetical protein